MHHLNSLDPIEIEDGKLKTFLIEDKEVLRIFDTKSDPKKLTCFTFLEGNKLIKSFYETEFE